MSSCTTLDGHPWMDQFSFTDADAKEKLTRNATQLLNAVCVIIQAIDTATITLTDEVKEHMDLPKWVKLAKQKDKAAEK